MITQQIIHPIWVSYAQKLALAGVMGIPNGKWEIPLGGTRYPMELPWENGNGKWDQKSFSPMGVAAV